MSLRRSQEHQGAREEELALVQRWHLSAARLAELEPVRLDIGPHPVADHEPTIRRHLELPVIERADDHRDRGSRAIPGLHVRDDPEVMAGPERARHLERQRLS
nr:hypothetical protein [Hyalangium gracile]